jgi:hypothetical protein
VKEQRLSSANGLGKNSNSEARISKQIQNSNLPNTDLLKNPWRKAEVVIPGNPGEGRG